MLKTLDNIKQFILNVGNWLKKALDKGAQYAAKNPQIKVDTVKLRNYATRVYNVNKRLRQLDGDLRDLSDLRICGIFCSPTFSQVKAGG